MYHKVKSSSFKSLRVTEHRKRSIAMVVAMVVTAVALISAPISVASAQSPDTSKKTLRIGYFPNITHSQAVIGLNNGDLQKVLGDNITVVTFRFNAGPSAIESLLAGR